MFLDQGKKRKLWGEKFQMGVCVRCVLLYFLKYPSASYDLGDTDLPLATGLKMTLHVKLWVTSASFRRVSFKPVTSHALETPGGSQEEEEYG